LKQGELTALEAEKLSQLNAITAIGILEKLSGIGEHLLELVKKHPELIGSGLGATAGAGLGAWNDQDNRLRGALTGGLGGAAGGQPQVGIVPLDAGKLEAVKQDLRASPPKEFDIARIERVFNSALHFVELEILNYRFSAKKVRLDAELFGMGDDYLRERVENTFKPFADAEFLTVQIPKLSAAVGAGGC